MLHMNILGKNLPEVLDLLLLVARHLLLALRAGVKLGLLLGTVEDLFDTEEEIKCDLSEHLVL